MAAEVETKLSNYQLVEDQSELRVEVYAEGLLASFGHDPVIIARALAGRAEFVVGTFENAAVNLRVNAKELVITNVKEKDRQEVERSMRDEVLEISRYPEIIFKSNSVSVSRLAERRYRTKVIGSLSLHGVVQQFLWISAEANFEEESFRARGEVLLKPSDFRIKPPSVAGGMLKVRNEVKCVFDVAWRRIEA